MSAIRAERDYVIHEDFMKVCLSGIGGGVSLLYVSKINQ